MSSSETSSLVRKWLGRLAGAEWADLGESLDDFPELRDAIAPPTFRVAVSEGAVLGEPASGYLEAGIDAYLVPPGEALPTVEEDEVLPDLNRYGHIDLGLDTGTSELRLSTLDIPPAAQTGGLGTIVLAQLAELGQALGLESIHLEAGKIGRWAWLRCGFDFDWPEQRDAVVAVAAQAAERLGRDIDLSAIQHAWDFADLPGTVTGEELEAGLGVRIGPADQPVSLGKALILGPPPAANPWWGRLDLGRESEGYVRLKSYVRSRARSSETPNQEEA
jgi:hypothetical protein